MYVYVYEYACVYAYAHEHVYGVCMCLRIGMCVQGHHILPAVIGHRLASDTGALLPGDTAMPRPVPSRQAAMVLQSNGDDVCPPRTCARTLRQGISMQEKARVREFHIEEKEGCKAFGAWRVRRWSQEPRTSGSRVLIRSSLVWSLSLRFQYCSSKICQK